MQRFVWVLAVSVLLAKGTALRGAELARLSEDNWRDLAPSGKEVDWIYGDFVLRNEQIVVVIGDPLPTRHANMTVRNVGWAIIDMTRRDANRDQLSAFYPASAATQFTSADAVLIHVDGQPVDRQLRTTVQGKEISLECSADGQPAVAVRYTLRDGDPYVQVETIFRNATEKPTSVEAKDTLRADRTFTLGGTAPLHLFWAHDDWFRQAYGLQHLERTIVHTGERGVVVEYQQNGSAALEVPAGGEAVLTRRMFPAGSLLELHGIAAALSQQEVAPLTLTVIDPAGPVRHARVELQRDGQNWGSGRTDAAGKLHCQLPPGDYQVLAKAIGRPDLSATIQVATHVNSIQLVMQPCGYVRARITDAAGQPIPCKVAFHGVDGTETPQWGPDTAVAQINNLRYSPNGRFRQEIAPGNYEVIISYGPEYDAYFTKLQVNAGETTRLQAQLQRVVDTKGWISADFHSHSSPSGDNTASQRGRVLNLLSEHIEFAPCTEHNRISTYAGHLKALNAESRLATCTGIELTGLPLPLNHQNAFPLKFRPRTQNGGGPLTDENPIAQIARLAMWDDNSEKLVQINHPNIVHMIGDRDGDGQADGGFAEMLNYMDVIEVHPLQAIFVEPGSEQFDELRSKPVFHWMQLLNLGYRAPGVVNTDAHYQFHGSGGWRNFIRSEHDDPASIDPMDMVRAATAGHIVMSNGPFMEVSLRAADEENATPAGPGDEVSLPAGKAEVTIRVHCPNWLDVNRVQLFINGRASQEHNETRRAAPESFGTGVVKYDGTMRVTLSGDAHIIVATCGEGLEVGRVMGPKWGVQMPVAVSNPIFVDVDGNGFQPNGDLLDVSLPLEKTDGLPQRR